MHRHTVNPIIIAILLLFSLNKSVQAQTNKTNKVNSTGVSVSPSHFHFGMKPGESKSYSITINNSTPKAKSFNLNIFDFNMNGKGKSSFLPPGQGEYSLSKWLNISPTFVELKPFEKKKVGFTVSIPNTEAGNKAAWSIIMVELQEERKKLNPKNKNENTVALGVIPTFAFGIFAYQNPPTVVDNSVEFIDFLYEEKDAKRISIVAENTGDGISYCTSYIDLTNLTTGKQERLPVKKFTILPGLIRDFVFEIPSNFKKGKYLAVGVLDFENSEEIQAAKLEFELN